MPRHCRKILRVASPWGKAEIIEELQRAGKIVCYVGDGINDAIALKKAHISISLSGASSAATDTAQIILMDERTNFLVSLSWHMNLMPI